MRHDHQQVFELRRQGMTYREIQKIVGISRDTLSKWFKNEEWSTHIKKSNIEKQAKKNIEHIKKMNKARNTLLESKYKKVEEDAEKEFELYKNEPLFAAGIMLYAGEGDKLDKGQIRLANIDFCLHKVFIKFCEKFLKTDQKRIKFSIVLYPDLDISSCVKKWSSELNILEKNFYKPQVITGKLKTRKLHFGVGTTIILDSFLKRKLLFWIEKGKLYLS